MVVAAKKLVPLKKAAKKAPVEEEELEIEEEIDEPEEGEGDDPEEEIDEEEDPDAEENELEEGDEYEDVDAEGDEEYGEEDEDDPDAEDPEDEDEEIDDGSGTRSKQWKSGLELEAGISKPMKGLDELWPFITTMKMADGDGKNDKGLSNKNVLSVVGRLMGKTYHQFLDEVEELSPETNDDILTVKEVNKYLRENQKQVVFYEIEKEEFDFDNFMEDHEEEEWGVLYMREDNSGSCVTWIKGKGFLDYNKTRNPKPNDMDGETEIKTMIELLFEIEEDDWADQPEEDAEEGAEDEEVPPPKKKGKKVPSKATSTAGSKAGSVAGSKPKAPGKKAGVNGTGAVKEGTAKSPAAKKKPAATANGKITPVKGPVAGAAKKKVVPKKKAAAEE